MFCSSKNVVLCIHSGWSGPRLHHCYWWCQSACRIHLWLGNTWDLSYWFARRRILVLSKTKPRASFLLDVVFLTDQLPAQLFLFRYWKETKTCKTNVYLLPKHLDRSCLVVEGKVARLHLPVLGMALTVLTQETKNKGSFADRSQPLSTCVKTRSDGKSRDDEWVHGAMNGQCTGPARWRPVVSQTKASQLNHGGFSLAGHGVVHFQHGTSKYV